MRTYEIEKTAGYKGCGEALAEIIRAKVISLHYVNDVVSPDDWADVSDDENPYLLPAGEDKIRAFMDIQKDNGCHLVRGMCSCWQFVVLQENESR
jgi:hypothetical protein